ncbi:MAG TPA: HAMP domain-containing sensor histidine kinase [Polyangiaceae bacterium]
MQSRKSSPTPREAAHADDIDAPQHALERTSADSGSWPVMNARENLRGSVLPPRSELAQLAHEIRDRIHALSSLGASMRRRVDDSRRDVDRDWLAARLDCHARCVEQLTHVLDTVLCAYRTETGALSPARRREDLCDIVRDVLRGESDLLRVAGCETELEAPEHVFGIWDRAQLELAVLNLLNNASKYGAGRSIEVRVSATDETAFLSVRDHGPGIRAEDVQKLFRPFARIDRGDAVNGVGLGLWFVHAIATAHGGEVSAASHAQGGACFTLRLPRRPRGGG